MRLRTAGPTALLLLAPLAHAQAAPGLGYVPPALGDGLDRNDAGIWYLRAENQIAFDAFEADSDLIWASRLNPSWAMPVYGRALCQERIWSYDARLAFAVTGQPEAPTTIQLKFYDSLQVSAMAKDPFPERTLETSLQSGHRRSERIKMQVGKKTVKLPAEVDQGDIDFKKQDYKAALADWATALRKMPELYWVHGLRAQAFYALRQYDSTIAQLRILADTLTKIEHTDLVTEFSGRAVALYAIAQTEVQRDAYDSARKYFQEAITVDVRFYMAHARLAGIALLVADTATAMSELQSAIQIDDADPGVLFYYGYLLAATGHLDSAAVELHRAIDADPYYAAPYELLGRIFEARGRMAEAVAAYQGFIDHAMRTDPQLFRSVARVAALGRPAAPSK